MTATFCYIMPHWWYVRHQPASKLQGACSLRCSTRAMTGLRCRQPGPKLRCNSAAQGSPAQRSVCQTPDTALALRPVCCCCCRQAELAKGHETYLSTARQAGPAENGRRHEDPRQRFDRGPDRRRDRRDREPQDPRERGERELVSCSRVLG